MLDDDSDDDDSLLDDSVDEVSVETVVVVGPALVSGLVNVTETVSEIVVSGPTSSEELVGAPVVSPVDDESPVSDARPNSLRPHAAASSHAMHALRTEVFRDADVDTPGSLSPARRNCQTERDPKGPASAAPSADPPARPAADRIS